MKSRLPTLVAIAVCSVCLLGCSKPSDGKSEPADGQASPKTATAEDQNPKGPVELKVKWTSGNRLVQRMDMTQQVITFAPRMPRPMTNDVTMGQDFAVSVLDERKDGGRDLELEFLSMQIQVTMGERSVLNFDSHGEASDDERSSMMAGFRQLVGLKIKVSVDASNQVEKVEGLQEFKSRILTNAPMQARALFEGIFSEDYFKQMVNYRQALPDKPVSPGDTWPMQAEIAMGALGLVQVEARYTFRKWEKREKRNCALLEYDGTIKMKPGKGGGFMGMNMSFDDSKTSGKSWFDPEAGMFVESAIKQDMKMVMTIPGQMQRGARTNFMTQPQTITNLMNQKITLKFAKEGGGNR